MPSRPITFLSDYGYEDEFAGVCRGVISRIAPDAKVIDLTHGISRHAVSEGALTLANALRYTPPGVHLAVVDPGVGTPRRALAVRTGANDRILVGPDNGLLAPSIDSLGGAVDAVDVSLSAYRLEPISATFHGRDIFAPVAAHLAAGAALEEAGEPVDPASLVSLPVSEPAIERGRVVAHVVSVDRYGNAVLDLRDEHLPQTGLRMGRAVSLETGGQERRAVFTLTFADADPGGLLLYEDSNRSLAIAQNRGSASEALRLTPGDEVVLRAAD